MSLSKNIKTIKLITTIKKGIAIIQLQLTTSTNVIKYIFTWA